MATVTKTVQLKFSKSTPGTRVYATDDPEGLCQTLYLKKSHLPDPPPMKVTMTVSYEDQKVTA